MVVSPPLSTSPRYFSALRFIIQVFSELCFYQLYEQTKKGEKPDAKLGQSRDYNIDLIPKFIMAAGEQAGSDRFSKKNDPYLSFS
jgi:hypothetical protein